MVVVVVVEVVVVEVVVVAAAVVIGLVVIATIADGSNIPRRWRCHRSNRGRRRTGRKHSRKNGVCSVVVCGCGCRRGRWNVSIVSIVSIVCGRLGRTCGWIAHGRRTLLRTHSITHALDSLIVCLIL